ncbi:MAG: dockerin type I repeat-containing protein, partial [Oscillospiraceae bacterium]|nr:dockerin type I repeat-containing protein [Oscillospiraceae bacterium]
YNSCRTPWRIGMDYLVNQNEDALAFVNAINSFMIKDTNNDPWEIKAGYKPDGTQVEDYNDLCFTAPFLVAAACTDNAEWHDEIRDTVINYGDDVYYGDTIKMLCLIADDGGWLVPTKTETHPFGDINMDGTFSVTDIVLLQKYLIKAEMLSIEQGKIADVNKDNTINIFDLILLKRSLTTKS